MRDSMRPVLRWLLDRLRPAPWWDDPVYWALDLETSGLDPKSDRILSVGMVPIRRGAIAWGERFYSLTHPGSFEGLTREAITVHHILPEELAEAPPFDEVLPEIAERLAGDGAGRESVLLAHHAPLDLAFLGRAFRGAKRPWHRPRVVDTRLLISRLEHRRQRLEPYPAPLPRALSEIREHLGLPACEYHHALSDALATAELFLVLRKRLGAETLRQLT